MNHHEKNKNNNQIPLTEHPDPLGEDKQNQANPKPATEHPDPNVPGVGQGSGKASTYQTDYRESDTTGVKGSLTYEDKVIQKIIGIAIGQIDGLLTVDGGFFSNVAEKLVNTDNVASGINTEVGQKQVAVDMDIVVEYGRNIPDIADEIKQVIHQEVAQMTELDVIEVNVNVVDIKTREQYEEDSETIQDKVTSAAETTGHFASRQTEKAKQAVSRGTRKMQENDEPRVK